MLGTSLDLILFNPRAREAEEAEAAALKEIDRLCEILSTYNPTSEISRINASRGLHACSGELREVIAAYRRWNHRTSGAISAEVGGLVDLWKKAEVTQKMPSLGAIAAALNEEQPLNVDALGKAYVMEKAATAVLRVAPETSGMLLNVGGDILLYGTQGGAPWLLGVADPAEGRDNSRALTSLSLNLTKTAITTSGIYERGYRFGEQSYSHILDPRTGRPSEAAAGATVIAADGITANALATALCILPSREGLKLVEETPDAECLVVERDGTQWRSSGFGAYERPRFIATADAGWHTGFEVSIELTLKAIAGNRVRRPYVAVWAEDTNKKLVRNIAVWANKPRYLQDLNTWWDRNGNHDVSSMTRATRPPGRYRLVWDGLDDKGRPVSEGTYRICVETNREHGSHAAANGLLECSSKPATVMLKETGEFEAITVEYGPRRQTA